MTDEVTTPSGPTHAGAATLRADPEQSWLSERENRHGGLRQVAGDTITMPSHAVFPVSIQIACDAIELHAIALAQRLRHVTEYLEPGFVR
jgi:hypothetical protein